MAERTEERLSSRRGVDELAPGSGGAAGSCVTSGSFIASPLAGRDYKAVIRRSELLAREISTDNRLRCSLLPIAEFDATLIGALRMDPIVIRTFRRILERNHQARMLLPVELEWTGILWPACRSPRCCWRRPMHSAVVLRQLTVRHERMRQPQSGSGQARSYRAIRVVDRTETFFVSVVRFRPGYQLLTEHAANVTNSNWVCLDCDWFTQDKWAASAASH